MLIKKIFILTSIIFLFSCSLAENRLNVLEGVYLFNGGYNERAIEIFQKEYKKNKDFTSLYNLATIYLKTGDYKKSIETFEIFEKENKSLTYNSFKLIYNKAVAYYKNREYKKSYEYFKKALDLDNNNLEAKINFEILYNIINSKKEKKVLNDENTQDNLKNVLKDNSEINNYINSTDYQYQLGNNKEKTPEKKSNDW